MATQIITVSQQISAAQRFNLFSMIAVVIPVLIPIWIALSIFVYCSLSCYPSPKVCDYLKPAGYRFYGLVGTLVAVLNFSALLSKMVGGGLNLAIIIWVLALLIVVPFGLRDYYRAKHDNWQEMTVECSEDCI